jgi:hypothetical protein
MDLDDLLTDLFGDVALEHTWARRLALLARMLIGLVGTLLGLFGAYVMMTSGTVSGTPALRMGMASVLVALACFSVFNVMLGRRWRWPWLCFLATIVGLFALRLSGN